MISEPKIMVYKVYRRHDAQKPVLHDLLVAVEKDYFIKEISASAQASRNAPATCPDAPSTSRFGPPPGRPGPVLV